MDRFSPLPDDLAACQALIRQQPQQLDAQAQQLDAHVHTIESHALTIEELERQKQELKRKHEELQLAYNELLQRAFARRSERYVEDPNQLKLDFAGIPGVDDAAAGLAEAVHESRGEIVIEQTIPEHKRRRVLRPRQEALPDHLPRYEVQAPVPDDVQHCPEHGPRKLIGYDRVETLEFMQPKLRVRVTLYAKYACEHEPQCGVASPERPASLVEGNRYDSSVAAQIITAKYAFHTPIYREISPARAGRPAAPRS